MGFSTTLKNVGLASMAMGAIAFAQSTSNDNQNNESNLLAYTGILFVSGAGISLVGACVGLASSIFSTYVTYKNAILEQRHRDEESVYNRCVRPTDTNPRSTIQRIQTLNPCYQQGYSSIDNLRRIVHEEENPLREHGARAPTPPDTPLSAEEQSAPTIRIYQSEQGLNHQYSKIELRTRPPYYSNSQVSTRPFTTDV